VGATQASEAGSPPGEQKTAKRRARVLLKITGRGEGNRGDASCPEIKHVGVTKKWTRPHRDRADAHHPKKKQQDGKVKPVCNGAGLMYRGSIGRKNQGSEIRVRGRWGGVARREIGRIGRGLTGGKQLGGDTQGGKNFVKPGKKGRTLTGLGRPGVGGPILRNRSKKSGGGTKLLSW